MLGQLVRSVDQNDRSGEAVRKPDGKCIMLERKLGGRRALITGGSRGIGRAVAVRFAREGARVAINYHGNREAAEECLSLVEAAAADAGLPQDEHFIVQGDVGAQEDVERMFGEVERRFGGLDILINNAGIQAEAPSESASPED